MPNYKPRTIPQDKTQVNFIIENAILEKVRDLSFTEGVSQSEVYKAAIEKFIELYEKKHGKIKPRPKGRGLDSI